MKIDIHQEQEYDAESIFLDVCKVLIALLLVSLMVYGIFI